MLINDLAKDIHENAVAHGWWEGNREKPEILALVHSEWSEALEEARDGRPMVWYACPLANLLICDFAGTECQYKGSVRCTDLHRKPKPEGIAVELIDGVIRILDYLGKFDGKITEKDGSDSTVESLYRDDLPTEMMEKLPDLICLLHYHTAMALGAENWAIHLLTAAAYAMTWVYRQGLDPLAILIEKHEYNKGRPYKHGKRF